MGIREGGNVKKCRPVVKEPSGGTLLFRFALPARSASLPFLGLLIKLLTLPRRCLHGVHPTHPAQARNRLFFASALPARGASPGLLNYRIDREVFASALPARGASSPRCRLTHGICFASALPARGASENIPYSKFTVKLCLGAACTGCIEALERLAVAQKVFASALPARGASIGPTSTLATPCALPRRCLHGVHRGALAAVPWRDTLPRRCLHGVHRQKPTNCGTPSCSIRRESVDSFSEINIKDSCADYFPALFCCQDDLHHHYRQPRTGNRPVLRCEQHRLFLFILSSHYRRLL